MTKKLEEANAWFGAISEFTEKAFIGITFGGTIFLWNKAAEKLFGYRAEELYWQNIRVLMPPNVDCEFYEILEKVKKRMQGMSR